MLAKYLESLKGVLDQWHDGLIDEQTAWKQVLAQIYMASTDTFNTHYRRRLNEKE